MTGFSVYVNVTSDDAGSCPTITSVTTHTEMSIGPRREDEKLGGVCVSVWHTNAAAPNL